MDMLTFCHFSSISLPLLFFVLFADRGSIEEECVVCPEGKFRSGLDDGCISCPDGTTSPTQSMSAQDCTCDTGNGYTFSGVPYVCGQVIFSRTTRSFFGHCILMLGLNLSAGQYAEDGAQLCWYVSTSAVPWLQARDACVAMGRLLAILNRPVDVDRLPAGSYWLGASDIQREGAWKWQDGSIVDSSGILWCGRQPDNFDGWEDCAETGGSTGFGYVRLVDVRP